MGGIIVNHSGDVVKGTLEALAASPLGGLVKPGARVSVKPNMVLARPPSEGATTHPEIVEGIIIFLREKGVFDIEIIESAWVGDDTKRVYRVCGFDKLSEKYGARLYDLKDDKIRKVKAGNYTFEICEKALETDFLINVPVLKAHCQTRMTCCLKNLKGCISDREKRNFHAMGLHRPIAYLNAVIKTSFCVIDGICGDLTFEEGGNPVARNMIICGQDPVLLDSYCAGLLGFDAADIDYIGIASDLGVGRLYGSETPVIELNADNKPSAPEPSGLARRLSAHIDGDKACSACYSALISALNRAGRYRGGKICVGQGFRGKSGKLGCGDCASGFENYVKGCPPSAAEIAKWLTDL
ncbi:MAG: DUF362 domain-containing protein [Oscillospiraceae bacterium]|jgi:uncharacterized protein (DUF362 family)|nr:DUF362 domain-containing protein [Oscillospiraceae bacterium]